ncbi:hypothetical protein GWI33_004139 [Rhynchophorus ferrugineus]|uniref:Uncharacterized protein n=1 Tax=Rhynchophorus ferrugineus TaxID=354439 RepID=A0A834HK55_RHYFE|nr:hypothetical protein GWI33_004139 [Rhynchophorus ferrugineus]
MNKKEFRVLIKYCFLKGKNTVEAKTWLDFKSEVQSTVIRRTAHDEPAPKRGKPQQSASKVMKDNQQQLLHSVIGPFEGRNRRKTAAFEEKESAASPRQCTVSKPVKTMAKIHELCFELRPHPLYSPDLTLSDYFLFLYLKRIIAGKKFSSNDEKSPKLRPTLKQTTNRTTKMVSKSWRIAIISISPPNKMII